MERFAIIDSPLGPMLAREQADCLTGLDFVDSPPLNVRLEESPLFSALREQLNTYFEGRLRDFNIPIAPTGTPFQQRVWQALRAIPYGETRSYSQIAAVIGQPRAQRAVGSANHANPISILQPCHRVIAAGGGLGGYGGGLDRKRALLELEANSK